MKLIGSYKLNVKKEIVWLALNNPDILKQCIPGCESFEKKSDTNLLAKMVFVALGKPYEPASDRECRVLFS